MTNNDLLNLILGDQARIILAIQTGAQWEVWMQVELYILLAQNGKQVAREVPYPAPNQALKLDLLAGDNQGRYAIELKVESATNAGQALLNSIGQDINKIAQYHTDNLRARWVAGIAYSAQARNALHNFANTPANHAIYQEANSIGVLIVTV